MSIIVLALVLQAGVASSADAKTTSAPDKPICKRAAATGSFVRAQKVCLTKQQWQRVADDSQELGRSMRPALTAQTQ